MTGQIAALHKLQTVDEELYRLRRQQVAKPQELEASRGRLAAEEAKLAQAEDQLKTLQPSGCARRC